MDLVLTFEELRGMFEAKSIDFSQIPDQEAQYAASAPGVGFAASGGVAKAVEEVIEKLEPGRQVKTVYAEGLRECRQMLRMARTGKYNGYLLEGMACPGGCIAGAGTVQPPEKSRRLLEQYKAKAPKSNPDLNSPPARQYDVLSDRWGIFYLLTFYGRKGCSPAAGSDGAGHPAGNRRRQWRGPWGWR